MARIRRDRYVILSSPATPVPLELHPHLFKASALITWSLYLVYSVYELALTYRIQRSTPHRVLWRTWITVFADFFLGFQEAVLVFNVLFALFTAEGGEHPRPSLWLKGRKAPRVDALITCCGEGVDVVANTILAAASQDYPEGRLRVFVLDDGASEELRSAVEAIDKEGMAQVKYLSRTVKEGQRSYFKAGNLKFGIEESKRGGGAEFVAGLDADMIPESGWLRKMVPHLEVDEGVGIACPPQHYYNVPPSDPLGQSADFEMFFSVQEILNDRLGAAMCTGSGYVARRSALEAIGGWPLAESGEDYMCSALLGNEGWKIVFVRERLQLGMAPGSLRAMARQRMRWTDAGVEVHKQFGYYLPFLKNKIALRMTAGQRAANGLYMLRDYAPLANVLALGTLPCCLMLPHPESATATVSIASIRTLYALYACSFVAHKLNTIICFGHVGLSRVYNFQAQEIWAAPYMAARLAISFVPERWRPAASFTVCGTIGSRLEERSRERRADRWVRMTSADVLGFVAYGIFATVAIVGFLGGGGLKEPPDRTWMLSPGPIVRLVRAVWSVGVPVVYMLWPPSVEEGWGRDGKEGDFLVQGRDGVRRPRKGGTTQGRGNGVFWAMGLIGEMVVLCFFWC